MHIKCWCLNLAYTTCHLIRYYKYMILLNTAHMKKKKKPTKNSICKCSNLLHQIYAFYFYVKCNFTLNHQANFIKFNDRH